MRRVIQDLITQIDSTRIVWMTLIPLACGGESPPGPPPPPADDSADIVATIAADDSAAVGGSLTYTIEVRNDGPSAATDVVVIDSLPASVTVNSISNGGSADGRQVTWPAISTLARNGSREFEVTVTPETPGDLSSRVFATASTDDPDPSNNDGSSDDASVVTTVIRAADLRLTHTGANLAVPGDTITYTLEIENLGPSDAENVQVVDTLPAGSQAISVSDGGSASGRAVEWPTTGTLAGGESLTYTVTAIAPAVGPAVARAAAAAATADPQPGNNSSTGVTSQVRTVITFGVIYSITGEAAGDQFGWLVENLGDVDGDLVPDFVATAPTSGAGGQNAGRAYVYSGATGTELYRLTGQAGERFGSGVDMAGDIDGDNVPDLIVGAPGIGSGSAYVYSGASGALIRMHQGENAGDQFGWAVGRAGDVNNDGRDDVLVGAINHSTVGASAGRAYVFSGLDGSLIHALDPAVAGANFGHAVGGVGDLNADGFDDLAIGAPGTGGGGRVYVMSGATGAMLYGSIPPDANGVALGQFWIASPGDLNSDGVPDIFASDISNSAVGANTGSAYVYSGASGSVIHTFTGEAAGDQFGIGRGAGDADGDGVGDVLVAGWLNSEGGNQAGKAYLYSGSDGALLRTFTGTTAGDNLGFDAVGLGDVDGDGLLDFLLTGGISGSTPGRVDVVAGEPLP